METNQVQQQQPKQARPKQVFCKVFIAMPNNWKNRSNAMKRALGAIQRANMHLAILGVDNPADATAHYFIDTRGERWVLRKHKQLQLQDLESIPLNQGDATSLDFTKQQPQQQSIPVPLPVPAVVLPTKLA